MTDIRKEVDGLVRSRVVVWLRTREELRAERAMFDVARRLKMEPRVWRTTVGLTDALGVSVVAIGDINDPRVLLRTIPTRLSDGRELFIIEDLASAIANDPTSRRLLRDLVRQLPKLPIELSKGIVVVDDSPMPDYLRGLAYELDFPLPDKEVLSEAVEIIVKGLEEPTRSYVLDAKTEIIRSSLGLEAEEASIAVKRCLVAANGDGPNFDSLLVAKKAKMKEGAMEWYDPDPRGLDAIGGLDNLKDWLVRRRRAFMPEAREWGLPPPKGILIAGIPGCGKSLTAKAVATVYKNPLLRFDIAAVFGKFIGDSEKGMRDAIRTAKALAPCIIWIDELEKAFAGAGGTGDADSGTTKRVFGTFLTFLQENPDPIFTIATANDVSQLPPEFLRAGRFDQIFWVDLPTVKERQAIIEVMRRKYRRCAEVDSSAILDKTAGLTGAEIEEGFKSALQAAFSDEREPTTEDVLSGLAEVVPIVQSFGDKLNAARKWATSGARPASRPDETTTAAFRGFE